MLYTGRWICKISTNASGTIIIISLCVAHSKVTTPRALFFVFCTPAFLAPPQENATLHFAAHTEWHVTNKTFDSFTLQLTTYSLASLKRHIKKIPARSFYILSAKKNNFSWMNQLAVVTKTQRHDCAVWGRRMHSGFHKTRVYLDCISPVLLNQGAEL